MTTHERLLWLAKQEVDCPDGCTISAEDDENTKVVRHALNCSCKGTGKVPCFPTLRGVCPICYGYKSCTTKGGCRGRGWVPADEMEDILPCAHEWHFKKLEGGTISAQCRLAPNSADTLEHGPTYNEAAIAALYKAARREKKP